MTIPLAQLIVAETAEVILQKALDIATTLGLPVTSWAAGDPTRSDYHVLAETLSYVEELAANYAAAGFLDLAADLDDSTWLKATAQQQYGYVAEEATFATCTCQFSNTQGSLYEVDAGDITVKNSTTGKTYHTTSGGTLQPGPVSCTFTDVGDLVTATAHGLANDDTVIFETIVSTTGIVVDTTYWVVNKAANTFQVAATQGGAALALTTDGTGTYGSKLEMTVVADESGSDSGASIGEIDTMVTTLLGVTVANTTAAVGLDEESTASIVDGARNKLAALSPNGPADAYDYVAKNSTLTGTTAVTRTRTVADSATGDVTVYLAGPAGAVGAADVTLVEAAITTWAAPLCITPTVTNATNVTVAITYELWIYESVGLSQADVETGVEAALDAMFSTRAIGGDVVSGTGKLYHSLIESTIRNAYPDDVFNVAVTVPAGDTTLTIGQVATKGTITVTAINFIEVP
jgi:hypothetical protein